MMQTEGGSMKWESILSVVIPLLVVVSFAQNTRVEIKDVQPVQRFEQVISGHLADLNGKYKFRVSEVTYQPGGYVGDHNHVGPGVRVIMDGEFTYVKGDKTTVYKAGDAFFEPGDMTHRAYNRGNTILKVMNIEILPADFSGSALIPPQH
jgi:quercetin dioxygenase-like cupin family protein